MRRLAIIIMAVATGLVATAGAAWAGVGVGVGASPIVLASVAQPAHTYTLPNLYVVNTGNAPSSYEVRVALLGRGQGHVVPPAWVSFGQNGFRLGPDASEVVPVTLSVPAGAASGSYQSDLVASTVSDSGTGTSRVGAQSATLLEFRVGPAGGWHIHLPWWVFTLAGAVLLALGVVLLQRRLGVRVHIERKS